MPVFLDECSQEAARLAEEHDSAVEDLAVDTIGVETNYQRHGRADEEERQRDFATELCVSLIIRHVE
eukprot:CAMPEP_0179460224 /NCGR_PEP_ID=MMETSP0799-20121207/43344_1 /TAXON_ID=46947 /ORGANISM="Geminigera cryophila, Strain CCMP2564" /LENGTH=66 /DNA_ID=CAMNT_0021262401 /DNA_START=117 /DNA_END=317 /DNA_ORIENTATION=-